MIASLAKGELIKNVQCFYTPWRTGAQGCTFVWLRSKKRRVIKKNRRMRTFQVPSLWHTSRPLPHADWQISDQNTPFICANQSGCRVLLTISFNPAPLPSLQYLAAQPGSPYQHIFCPLSLSPLSHSALLSLYVIPPFTPTIISSSSLQPWVPSSLQTNCKVMFLCYK